MTLPRVVASLVTTVVALSLPGGCAPANSHAYEGPARPRGELASVAPDMFMATVREVDGRPVRPFQNRLYLLPGTHVLGIEARWTNRCRQWVEMPVELEAGTAYGMYVKEYRPVLTPLQGAGEVAVKLGTILLLPVTLPVGVALLAMDYAEPKPRKGHVLEVGLTTPINKSGGGIWHSHPLSATSPSGRKMEEMHFSVW
jgi:hypothetical protein